MVAAPLGRSTELKRKNALLPITCQILAARAGSEIVHGSRWNYRTRRCSLKCWHFTDAIPPVLKSILSRLDSLELNQRGIVQERD